MFLPCHFTKLTVHDTLFLQVNENQRLLEMVVNSTIPITTLENQDNCDCYLFLARSWSRFYELCRLRPDEPKNSSAFVGTEEQRCSTVFSRNVTAKIALSLH